MVAVAQSFGDMEIQSVSESSPRDAGMASEMERDLQPYEKSTKPMTQRLKPLPYWALFR